MTEREKDKPMLKIAAAKPDKATQTKLDTIEVTPSIVKAWKNPPFQRPLRVNEKVRKLAEVIKADEIIPGVLTLGKLADDTYILDGQHRREAFLLSGLESAYVDVRVHHFTDMGAMGQEFVDLNSQLVRFGPDDILRGLEGSCAPLRRLRERCPFVGYDNIRRGTSGPIISVSLMLRCWFGSSMPVPTRSMDNAPNLLRLLSPDEADTLADFAHIVYAAWGRDPEYQRLWGGLNVLLCMWLYRNVVLTQYSPRVPKVSRETFKKCMMGVSAAGDYVDWLVGRNVGERDRSPAYARLRAVVAQRIQQETGKKVAMPAPTWMAHSGSRK